MKLLMENWRHYVNEQKQQKILEQYFDGDNILSEEAQSDLLKEFDFAAGVEGAMGAGKEVLNILMGVVERGDKVGEVAGQVAVGLVQAPAEITATAEAGAEISKNISKSVDSIVAMVAPLLGPQYVIAYIAYKFLSLVFKYILKKDDLKMKELKAKLENPEGVEELKRDLTDALEKDPGLMSRLMSPVRKLIEKAKKLFRMDKDKKEDDIDIEVT